jgi:hypothetical protein
MYQGSTSAYSTIWTPTLHASPTPGRPQELNVFALEW